MSSRHRSLDVDAFFSDEAPDETTSLEGKALVRSYWRTRALREELIRKERYWSSVCEAFGAAYEELERTTRELAETRAVLLAARVEGRSKELLAFASELAKSPTKTEPGRVLNGRTRVLEPIGQGGSGIVYRADDDVLGGNLAVKLLRRPHDKEATIRFLAEAGAVCRVSHPAIVRPLHLDVSEDGLPYILMEHVDGRSLRAQLAMVGAWSIGAACRLGAVLVGALSAAHDAGLVHRDVKPGNVMLTTRSPGLRVLDFGIARTREGSTPSPRPSGRLVGTPAYMPPEQVLDPESVGPAADIYGAGATLFEAIAGRPPFLASTTERLVREHLMTPPARLDELRSDVPDALADVIARMLEKRPEDRPSAQELVRRFDALADAVGALPPTAEAARLLAPRGEETL